MKHVLDIVIIDLELVIDGTPVSARKILDLTDFEPEIATLREIARREGNFLDNEAILNDDGFIIARRLDYVKNDRKCCYYAFLFGYDETGWPQVEPTMDDIEDDRKDAVYRIRWEQANNKERVEIVYMDTGLVVETTLLILPDDYGSGALVDNHELRRLAIEQEVFRPFPL